MEESPEIPLPHENNIPPFGHEETWEDVMISDDLTEGQRSQVRNLLHEYSDVFSEKPNLTNVAKKQNRHWRVVTHPKCTL